jgi:uncharacterized membrane protein
MRANGKEPMDTVAKRAILAAIGNGGRATTKEVRASTGLPVASISRAFHFLFKTKVIKRIGTGQYVKGSKEPAV